MVDDHLAVLGKVDITLKEVRSVVHGVLEGCVRVLKTFARTSSMRGDYCPWLSLGEVRNSDPVFAFSARAEIE